MNENIIYYDPFSEADFIDDLDRARNAIEILKKQFSEGHGKSAYLLGLVLDPNTVVVSDEIKKDIGSSDESAIKYYKLAFDRLLEEANNGNAESMHLVASYYQEGCPPVEIDNEKYKLWLNRAKNAGFTGGGQI